MHYNTSNDIKGEKLTICFMDEAIEGYDGVIKSLNLSASKGKTVEDAIVAFKAKVEARFNQFALTARLRMKDHFNSECDLPNKKKSYAVKVNKFRAYGWYSEKYPSTFIVSHFALKKGNKMSSQDKQRLISNWRKIEEN